MWCWKEKYFLRIQKYKNPCEKRRIKKGGKMTGLKCIDASKLSTVTGNTLVSSEAALWGWTADLADCFADLRWPQLLSWLKARRWSWPSSAEPGWASQVKNKKQNYYYCVWEFVYMRCLQRFGWHIGGMSHIHDVYFTCPSGKQLVDIGIRGLFKKNFTTRGTSWEQLNASYWWLLTTKPCLRVPPKPSIFKRLCMF